MSLTSPLLLPKEQSGRPSDHHFEGCVGPHIKFCLYQKQSLRELSGRKSSTAWRLFSRPLLMQSVLDHGTAAISSSSNTVSNTSYIESLASPQEAGSQKPLFQNLQCKWTASLFPGWWESSHLLSAISFKLNIVKSMDRARAFQMGNLSPYLISRREELNPLRRWGIWTKTCACAVPRYRCHSLWQWPNSEFPLSKLIFWPESKGWTFLGFPQVFS